MKAGTVALVVAYGPKPESQAEAVPLKPAGKSTAGKSTAGKSTEWVLVDTLSDDLEIGAYEQALVQGTDDPLSVVYEVRSKRAEEDEEFGDYVEELLSKPFVPPEVQDHGVQWFRSKNRIEQFQKAETEARSVIAEFAFKIFQSDPTRTDFVLASPNAEVRVRVFLLKPASQNRLAA
jgi:hypothetical protein